MVAKGYVLIGSPDQVAEKLREVAISLNVGQFMLLLQFGNMRKELAMYNTELFAAKVKPQIEKQAIYKETRIFQGGRTSPR